jgi:hypothetical protein
MPARRGVLAAVALAGVLAAVAGVARAAEEQESPVAIVAVDPVRPHAGAPLTIDVEDAAHRAVRVCLLPGAGSERCITARTAEDGVRRATFTAPYPGRWTIVADAADGRATRRLRVLPHGDRLVVLAAGDSLVDNLAHGLAGPLHLRRDAVLRRDVEIGRGLSKPDGFDWIANAQAAVSRWQPDVVVVFLGGNEGFDLGGVHCCAAPWVRRFGDLQQALMRAYAHDGSTRVYWTSLPAPGPSLAFRSVVWAAENAALETALLDDDARLFDANALFTPGYHWRRGMRWHRRYHVTRAEDQIHLNRTGGRIAAYELLKELRLDAVDVPARPTHRGAGHNVPRHKRTYHP